MARETIFRCDVCGAEKGVLTYKVVNEHTWEVDLCPKDAKPLMAIAEHGHKALPTTPGRRNPNQTYDPMVRGVE